MKVLERYMGTLLWWNGPVVSSMERGFDADLDLSDLTHDAKGT